MSKIRGQVGMSVGVLLHFFILSCLGGVNRLFAMIRELPSPLMFAFIRDQVGLGRFYIK